MKKYLVTCNITVQHCFEVEVEDDENVREVVRDTPRADIVQDFADKFNGDFSWADVDVESIMDDNGQYVYDGIGQV